MKREPVSAIAVLTSGGDAPGMNAAVRAVVAICQHLGLGVFGVRWGWQGLIDDDLVALDLHAVDGWNRFGGSELGSSRCPAFRTPEGRAQAAANLRRRGIGGVVVIGGDGSLTGAHALAAEASDLRVVGIPASIDNDIGCTTLALGVDTALNTIVEACDRIADTASAHGRTFIVEVMGRACGYLAMTSAVATGADGVLFREAGQAEDELVDTVAAMVRRAADPAVARRRVLIIKSEGVPIPVDVLKRRLDERLADLDRHVDTRVTVLGHVVRGGAPSAFDRVLAGRLAHAAVRALQRDLTDVMTGWHVLLRPGVTPPLVFDLDPYVTFWPLQQVLAETNAICDGSSEVTRWRVRLLREVAPFLGA